MNNAPSRVEPYTPSPEVLAQVNADRAARGESPLTRVVSGDIALARRTRSPYDQTPAPEPRKAATSQDTIDAILAPGAFAPAIDALLTQFREADIPHANPPEAAQVLETQTAPEVAGNPEPLTEEQVAEIAKATELEKFNAERVARGEKPLKRMPPPKTTRRTAGVVQNELDIALEIIAQQKDAITEQNAEIATLRQVTEERSEKQLAQHDSGMIDLQALVAESDKAAAELRAIEANLTERLRVAVDTITELRANEARSAETATKMSQQIADQKDVLAALRAENARLGQVVDRDMSGEDPLTTEDIVNNLVEAGWDVTLSMTK